MLQSTSNHSMICATLLITHQCPRLVQRILRPIGFVSEGSYVPPRPSRRRTTVHQEQMQVAVRQPEFLQLQ